MRSGDAVPEENGAQQERILWQDLASRLLKTRYMARSPLPNSMHKGHFEAIDRTFILRQYSLVLL